MPLVRVDIPERPSDAVKGRLRQAIWDTIEAALGKLEREIDLLFRERPAGDHWCGGEPLPEWTGE